MIKLLTEMYSIKINPVVKSTYFLRKLIIYPSSFHTSNFNLATTIDHYQTLAVDKNATKQQIKQSYYQLSKRYHPDVNKEAGSMEKFKNIQASYHILGDEQRKKEYDRSLRPMAYESRSPGSYGADSENPFKGKKFTKLCIKALLILVAILYDCLSKF